jgi:hypothetical protein
MEKELTWEEWLNVATYSFTCTMLLGILLVLA